MQKQSSATRGFTLIELLVVIAIIGILSSVILASLNTARQKGQDAAVQSNLATVRTQAELYYNDNKNTANAYGADVPVQGTALSVAPVYSSTGANMFIASQTINNALGQAISQGGGKLVFAIGGGGQSYAVAAELGSGSGWECVDSTGAEKKETGTAIPALGGGSATTPAACP